jgi:hypothetical protein
VKAATRAADALKAERLGLLTAIHIRFTMTAMLGIDGLRHRPLGACNPPPAYRAL